MNFLYIYLIVCVAIVLVINFYKLGKLKIDYEKMGRPLLPLEKGKDNSAYKVMVFRVIVGVAVLVAYIIAKSSTIKNFDWLTLAFVAGISIMLGTFIYPLFMRSFTLGLYERGALTLYGSVMYNDCKGFGFMVLRDNSTALAFISKIPFVQGNYIVVNLDEKREAKKILDRKLDYYNDVRTATNKIGKNK